MVFLRPTRDSMKTQFEQMMDGLNDVEGLSCWGARRIQGKLT